MTAAYGCAPVSQPDGCSLPNPPPLITDDSETRAIKIQTSEICFVPSFSLWSRWMGHKPRLDNVKAFFFSFFPWSCGDELLLTLHLCVGHKQCSTTKKDITHWSEGCVILYGRGLFDRIKETETKTCPENRKTLRNSWGNAFRSNWWTLAEGQP